MQGSARIEQDTQEPGAQDADRCRLKAAGARARACLEDNASACRVSATEAELFVLANFLTAAECAKTIALIDAVAKPSKLFDRAYSSGYRTSYSGNFDPHDPFVRAISGRIDTVLGLPASWGETLQGQRYEPGQQYQPHHDYFHPGTIYWDGEMARGGQRSFTAMAYCNAPDAGGATEFPELGITLDPEPGTLVVWNNADREGIPNPSTSHAGRAVIAGTKYVLTKWYRARAWR